MRNCSSGRGFTGGLYCSWGISPGSALHSEEVCLKVFSRRHLGHRRSGLWDVPLVTSSTAPVREFHKEFLYHSVLGGQYEVDRGMIPEWNICSRGQWPVVLSLCPPAAKPSCAHTASRAGVTRTRQQFGSCLKKPVCPMPLLLPKAAPEQEWGVRDLCVDKAGCCP